MLGRLRRKPIKACIISTVTFMSIPIAFVALIIDIFFSLIYGSGAVIRRNIVGDIIFLHVAYFILTFAVSFILILPLKLLAPISPLFMLNTSIFYSLAIIIFQSFIVFFSNSYQLRLESGSRSFQICTYHLFIDQVFHVITSGNSPRKYYIYCPCEIKNEAKIIDLDENSITLNFAVSSKWCAKHGLIKTRSTKEPKLITINFSNSENNDVRLVFKKSSAYWKHKRLGEQSRIEIIGNNPYVYSTLGT